MNAQSPQTEIFFQDFETLWISERCQKFFYAVMASVKEKILTSDMKKCSCEKRARGIRGMLLWNRALMLFNKCFSSFYELEG